MMVVIYFETHKLDIVKFNNLKLVHQNKYIHYNLPIQYVFRRFRFESCEWQRWLAKRIVDHG